MQHDSEGHLRHFEDRNGFHSMTCSDNSEASALRHVEQLRLAVRGILEVGPILEMAQLSIEPFHREDQALTLAQFACILEPDQPRGLLLQAYLGAHYLITDEAASAAQAILRDLINRQCEVGAAAVLLDELLRRRNPESRYDANIELLYLSLDAEPDWSINHLRLGRALLARGESEDARAHIDHAIVNLIDPLPDPVAESFEDCFTGRRASRERLILERSRIH